MVHKYNKLGTVRQLRWVSRQPAGQLLDLDLLMICIIIAHYMEEVSFFSFVLSIPQP